MQDKSAAAVDEIVIIDMQGRAVADFKHVKQFNMSTFAAGMYTYRLQFNGATFMGKLIKL